MSAPLHVLALVLLSATSTAPHAAQDTMAVTQALAPAPQPIKGRQPRYPLDALAAQIDGAVSVAIMIGPNGRVVQIDQLAETPQGHGFFLAVAAALRSWRFPPEQAGPYRLDVAFDHRTAPPPAAPPPNATDLSEAPEPLRSLRHVYPPKATAQDREGEVELVITIGPNLDVTAVALVSENPKGFDFAERAMDSAQSMEFPPGTPPGQYRLTIDFDLFRRR